MRISNRPILLLALVIGGCGVYSFKGEGISGIKTIAVEAFDNRTTEFGIREKVTDALIGRLLRDRTLTIAPPMSADATLSGVVISVTDHPLTYQANESVTEYQVSIIIQAKLSKRGVVEPIWQGTISGDGNYPYTSGSPADRQTGVDTAIDKIVQDLLNRLTSDW